MNRCWKKINLDWNRIRMREDEHLGLILILSSIDNWGAATAGPQFQWILHHDCRNQKCVWWRMVKNAPYWRKCMQWVFSGVGFLFYSHVLGTRFSQPSVCKSRPRKHCGHRAVLFNTILLPTTWPTSRWYLWNWRENYEKQHGFNTTSWQCGCQDLWRPHRSSTGDVWPLIRETLSFKCKFHFSASCRKEVERKLQKTRKNSKSPGQRIFQMPSAWGLWLFAEVVASRCCWRIHLGQHLKQSAQIGCGKA